MLVGFGHGLNVCHIDKKRFDRIGRLEGLRGSVIGAKLLPSQQGDDRGLQPLVAVVVHGPYVPSVPTSRPGTSHAPDEEFDPSGSMLQVLHTADVLYYQTTVEIYSLRKGIHIATVFRSPKVDVKNSRFGAHPVMPSPIGDLKVQAKGKFVVVSSGTSGEVFILESFRTECSEISIAFKCIGKVWTRTLPRKSRSVSTSSSESGHDGLHDALATVTRQTDSAILSLSPRWLAFVPPASSEQTTLHGEIVSEGPSQKAPGLSSHASPAEPQVSCDLDAPEAESLFNKAARDITQGVLKTAQWVGAEGRQAWSNYWSRPSEQHRQTPTGSPPPHEQQSFPPTHAQDSLPNRARNQPALVSVLDLEKLSKAQHFKSTNALQPLATFSAPSGCSLLSFSPSGVHLLTASAKGDVQHVWDLKRMVHGEAGHPGDPNASLKGPSVRQVAKITRMTEARIVDVVWMEPKDERLAIITDRGTVHINDIPFSAFLWPPPRRVARNAAASYKSSAPGAANDASGCPGSAGTGNTFTSAFGMFAGKTQPLLDAVRGRRTSTGGGGFPGFSGMAVTAGLGAKSGRAVAAGFNKSVGAAASGTVNTIRHLGENRLVLPGSLNVVSPGCVRWLCGKDHGHIAVSGGGIVRIYSVRQSNNAKAGQRRPSVVGDRPAEFKLPNEPMPSQHALSNQQLNARPFPERSTVGGSFWLPPPSASISRRSNMNTYPLSYAELDHTSGYQPFHTDRRVNLYVYNQDPTSSDTHPLENKNACVFGEAIPSTKVSVGTAAHEEGDMDAGQPAPEAQMENIISMKGNAEEGQQVVVTTRRKRQKNGVGASVGENEIFEDDCEVLDFAEERV